MLEKLVSLSFSEATSILTLPFWVVLLRRIFSFFFLRGRGKGWSVGASYSSSVLMVWKYVFMTSGGITELTRVPCIFLPVILLAVSHHPLEPRPPSFRASFIKSSSVGSVTDDYPIDRNIENTCTFTIRKKIIKKQSSQ